MNLKHYFIAFGLVPYPPWYFGLKEAEITNLEHPKLKTPKIQPTKTENNILKGLGPKLPMVQRDFGHEIAEITHLILPKLISVR